MKRPSEKARLRPSRQYTVRSVPADVDQALRRKARLAQTSLNQILLDALAAAAGKNGTPRINHDLDKFFGSMKSDPELDRILDEQRQVDEDMWR